MIKKGDLKKYTPGSFVMILVLCLTLFTFILSQVPSTDEVNGIKNVIDKYFTMKYEFHKTTIPQDFKSLEVDNPTARKWLEREKIREEIELYVATLYRLNYRSYKFSLDYKNINVKGNQAEILLYENHEVVFEACDPEVSEFHNQRHVITLEKRGNNWMIINDEYSDELSVVLKYESRDKIIENARETHDYELKQNPNSPQENPSQLERELPKGVFSYNRSLASAYAVKWCSGFNTLYKNYAPNDCANFVSQAIYEGTNRTMSIVDISHYTHWWYFTGSPRDGSLPWINVNAQKTFFTTNTQQGPYGSLVTSTCSLGVGDIVHLFNGSTWYHAVIIDGITNCNDSSKIFFSGHTYARCHYPLSYYASITKRYIHITGYRK
ncbi:MAG: amidase domain-containing protein [Acidobacteria bacterium]|nr:amidase domain-containing protein [Acidobacteriota bacterium]